MTFSALILLITILLFLIGFIGNFLPVLPGNAIVWFGIFLHKMLLPEDSISWTFFWIATSMAIIAQLLDFILTWWGARIFGATWQGAIGGLIGGIIGFIFFNLPGLILGPVAGVLIVEFAQSRDLRKATKAGFGTIVGTFLAFVAKLILTMLMIVGFFFSLYL